MSDDVAKLKASVPTKWIVAVISALGLGGGGAIAGQYSASQNQAAIESIKADHMRDMEIVQMKDDIRFIKEWIQDQKLRAGRLPYEGR